MSAKSGNRKPARAAKASSKPPAFDADVVVVGAGFAGMVAAYRLWQKSRSVIVVDAMDRVGGRSWSTRLSDGSFLDIGAGWTGATEHHILDLVKELKLSTYTQFGVEPTPRGKQTYEHLFIAANGDQRRYTGLNFPLGDDAAIEVVTAIGTINTMMEEVPLDAPWKAPNAAEWDSISAGVFVDELIDTPEAIAVVNANLTTIFGLNPYAVSLLHLLWDSRTAGGVDKFGSIKNGSAELRIKGGTQEIPLRIKKKLGDDAFVLNSPVTEIAQVARGVTVISERRTLRCRRVIVAIPTCLAGFIRFRPPMPADRAQLTQRVPQGSAMKIQLVYDRAFWRDEGLTGNSLAINGSIVPQTLDAGGPRGQDTPGIMSCFVDDDGARDLGRLGKEERKRRVIRELIPRFGKKAKELSKTIAPNYFEFSSQDLEWVRGDYAATPGPRVLTASGFGPAMRTPIDRIHWAGVDTATIWYQSIEGAAQSGVRAAAEVIKAGLR